ncbi:MAG: thermonuclease family protein [Weeksellaceae bacterium]|nr:thermonuclease family protein [Weeksellaceae bacterium]
MKYNATTPNQTVMESSSQENPAAKYFQIPEINVQPYYVVENVMDGDSLIVKHEFSEERKEIRLYGLDAPEVRINRKMREDEAKSRTPASLLLQYGMMSLDYVLQVCPPGTRITLLTEKKNQVDFWMRDLAYVILPGCECLNELLIANGWAKPTSAYYCSLLPDYQNMNTLARTQRKGIYSFTEQF